MVIVAGAFLGFLPPMAGWDARSLSPSLNAGGSFTSAGGSPANRSARWDGSQQSRPDRRRRVHERARLPRQLHRQVGVSASGGDPRPNAAALSLTSACSAMDRPPRARVTSSPGDEARGTTRVDLLHLRPA